MINMNVNTRGIDMKNDNVNNDNETKSSDLTLLISYKPSFQTNRLANFETCNYLFNIKIILIKFFGRNEAQKSSLQPTSFHFASIFGQMAHPTLYNT